jgi:hypothetical protein
LSLQIDFKIKNKNNMNDLILKYSLLNDLGKQELTDFINFLLTKNHLKVETTNVETKSKTVGALLASLGNVVNAGFADNIEKHQQNWQNWQIKSW